MTAPVRNNDFADSITTGNQFLKLMNLNCIFYSKNADNNSLSTYTFGFINVFSHSQFQYTIDFAQINIWRAAKT